MLAPTPGRLPDSPSCNPEHWQQSATKRCGTAGCRVERFSASVEPLEPRVFLAGSRLDPDLWQPPASGAPVYRAPGMQQLTVAHRQYLFDQLSGSIRTKLAPFIDKATSKVTAADTAKFDQSLLDYMRDRNGEHPESHWYFDSDQVPAILKQAKKDAAMVLEAEGTAALPGLIPDARAMQLSSVSYAGTKRNVHRFTIGDHPKVVDPTSKQRVDLVGLKHVAGGYINWLFPTAYGNHVGLGQTEIRNAINRFPLIACSGDSMPSVVAEALAYRWTGDDSFAKDLIAQFRSWMHQNQPLRNFAGTAGVSEWADYVAAQQVLWEPLNTASRVKPLLEAYHLMLGSNAWTGEVNTLFLLMMYRHANALAQWSQSKGGAKEQLMNKGYKELTSLMTLARIFPEFTDSYTAGGWKAIVQQYLPGSDAANFSQKITKFGGTTSYPSPDGLQKEQSPNYAVVVTGNLLDQFMLSKRNRTTAGNAFYSKLLNSLCKPSEANPLALPLEDRVNALLRIANPDGTTPELGDSYRIPMYHLFSDASVVAAGTWPTRKLGLTDLLGIYNLGAGASTRTTATPALNRSTVAVPGAPNTYSLPYSGFFMLEQKTASLSNSRDALQISFKAGPMGLRSISADGHSEYDLLNFELTGKKRPLIEDPGLYTYRRVGDGENNVWANTTNAHNSFTVDDYSHARMDGYFGYSRPWLKKDKAGSALSGAYVEGWHNGYLNLDPNGQGPRLARTIWYDQDSTILVIDWAKQKSTTTHTYRISFTMPLQTNSPHIANEYGVKQVKLLGGKAANGVYTDTSNLTGASKNTGNLLIQPISVPGRPATSAVVIAGTQDAAGKTSGPFATAPDNSGDAVPAARYTLSQRSNSTANFVTLIHPYDRTKVTGEVDQSVIASVVTQTDDSVVIDLQIGSKKRRLYFYSPFMAGGSAMINNVDAKPMEKAPDPAHPEQTLMIAALPRTAATAFPAGMGIKRPPPLDPKSGGPLVPLSAEASDGNSTSVRTVSSGVFSIVSLIDDLDDFDEGLL